MVNAYDLANLLGVVSTTLLLGAIWAKIAEARRTGRFYRDHIRLVAAHHVSISEQEARERARLEATPEGRRQLAAMPVRLEAVKPIDTRRFDLTGYDRGVFECAGCDRHFFRGQLGQVRICDGLEFCSVECHESPQPIPTVEETVANYLEWVNDHDPLPMTRVTSTRSLN